MPRYDVGEAMSKLSALLDQVQRGETVVIVRNGEPVAELVPPQRPHHARRRFGFAEGQIEFAPDWERAWTEAEAQHFLAGR